MPDSDEQQQRQRMVGQILGGANGGGANLEDEDGDIRARFAGIEARDRDEAAHDDLPPVPEVAYERPKSAAERAVDKTPGAAAQIAFGSSSPGNVKGMGQAMTIGTGLVGSIIVGAGLGWLVDHYLLHTPPGGTPWGLIVGFLVGVASGFVQLIRVTNQLND